MTHRDGRLGARRASSSFKAGNAKRATELRSTLKAIRHTQALTHRLEASIRRTDKREWVMQRRERTRHLIELGGLVVKAGLVELTDDDRAVIFGGLLAVADKLRGEEGYSAKLLWRRRGKRAFELKQGPKWLE